MPRRKISQGWRAGPCPYLRAKLVPAVALVDDMRGTSEAGARIFGAAQRVPVPGCE